MLLICIIAESICPTVSMTFIKDLNPSILKPLNQSISVLMVCLGNICRCPLWQKGIEKAINRKRITNWIVDSAGIGGWHEGDLPDQRAIRVAKITQHWHYRTAGSANQRQIFFSSINPGHGYGEYAGCPQNKPASTCCPQRSGWSWTLNIPARYYRPWSLLTTVSKKVFSSWKDVKLLEQEIVDEVKRSAVILTSDL